MPLGVWCESGRAFEDAGRRLIELLATAPKRSRATSAAPRSDASGSGDSINSLPMTSDTICGQFRSFTSALPLPITT